MALFIVTTEGQLTTALANAADDDVIAIKDGDYTGNHAVANGGDLANNRPLKIVGYKSSYQTVSNGTEVVDIISDLDYGAAYYESPLSSYMARIANGGVDDVSDDYPKFDGEGETSILLEMESTHAIEIRNIHFTGADYALNADTDLSNGNCFIGCKFTGITNILILGWFNHLSVIDCYLAKSTTRAITLTNAEDEGRFNLTVINCVILGDALDNAHIISSNHNAFLLGNLFIEGKGVFLPAASTTSPIVTLINNTCYGQVQDIFTFDKGIIYRAYNNIFDLAAQSDYLGYWNALKTASYHGDYNCLWSAAGQLTALENAGGNGKIMLGPNSIQADPQFVDAASGDFRPLNPSVLRGGRPEMGGYSTQMGTFAQSYQFANRGRTVNFGRLGIIR